MSWPSLTRFSLFVFLLVLAGAAGVRAKARLAPSGMPGLLVDGAVLPEDVSPEAFVTARADARLHRRVRLLVDGQDAAGVGTGATAPDHSVSLAELGVVVDSGPVVRRIKDLRTGGSFFERVERAKHAAAGEIDIPLEPRLDEGVTRPIVDRIKEWTDRSPVSARLDLDKHQVVGEKDGRYVDTDGALAAILRAADVTKGDAVVEVVIPTRSFPPHVSRAFVEKLDVNVVLSEYATGFSRAGDQARRGKNIDVAASKLDGLVLAPNELISFNGIVGERSEDNGFQKSWEIFKGEMVEGVGGGTCQVASTFYATVFFGGLDVTERLPHSRPSAYIPMGLDATVVYPIVDLKVRNPYDFPVVLHAKVTGNQLKMQLLGPEKPAKVSFVREVVEAFAYPRKVSVEQKLRWSKRVVLKQHGIRGYKIKRTRTLLFKDGRKKKEENTDLYPATAEIYEVPPDFDQDLLPPLPEDNIDEVLGGDGDEKNKGKKNEAPTKVEPKAEPVAPGTPLAVSEAPGAHAPTEAQVKPPRKLTYMR
jgi:vancomycin resistance protein YoaR